MTQFTPEAMQARFHELSPAKKRLEDAIAAKRVSYDALRNEIAELERTKLEPLTAEIKALEGELTPVETEMASLARALKGQTGAPPAAAPAKS